MALSPVVHATFTTDVDESVAAVGVEATSAAGGVVTTGIGVAAVSGAQVASSAGIAEVGITSPFGELSAVVHATFTTDSTISVTPDGVSATSAAGTAGWSAENADAALSAVVHATFTTGIAVSNGATDAVGVGITSAVENLGATSSEMEGVDGAAVTTASGDMGFLGANYATPGSASATFAAGIALSDYSAVVRPTGVVSTTGRGVPSWIASPDVERIPEGVESVAAAGDIVVELTQNPRVFGTMAFTGVGSVFVGLTSYPRVTGVGLASGAGLPTVTIGDISDLPPPIIGRRADFEFDACRAEWTFSRGAVIEFRG